MVHIYDVLDYCMEQLALIEDHCADLNNNIEDKIHCRKATYLEMSESTKTIDEISYHCYTELKDIQKILQEKIKIQHEEEIT